MVPTSIYYGGSMVNRSSLPSISAPAVIWCTVLVILCALSLTVTLGLMNGIRFDVPFTYEGDGLEYNLLTKTTIETGWWMENPMVGAPGILEMYDYAIGNNLDFLIMKILSLFTGNYAVVMNAYYILGFFLTAFCSLYVFRQFRIAYPVAVFGSLLYSFIFYHFNRIGHYNLTAYYMVPLMILVILWICQGESLFVKQKKSGLGFLISPTHKGYITLIILLITSTHSYYAFFGLLLVIVATLWITSRSFSVADLLNGLCAGIILILCTLLNKFPSLLYNLHNGPSYVMGYRYPFEAETWGLKLIQLLLPAPGHNIPFFADIAQKYTEYRPLVNENVSATLGIIGSFGLILLLGWVFINTWPPLKKILADNTGVMTHLSLLTISAVLIGTIGGISAIIAQVFPDIHSYNRISIYIGFFAIFAILIVFQAIFEKYRNTPLFCPVFLVMLLVILIAGIYDQVPSGYALNPGSDREMVFLSDKTYFSHLEETIKPGSSVFILPDIGGFPHSNPPGNISALDHVKPYLHTSHLKWSYPTMKGRVWDNWQVAVASSPPADLMDGLYHAGFSGLLIDGYGYADHGRSIFGEYQNFTGIPPEISENGRYAFYDLTSYIERKKEGIAQEQYSAIVQNYLQTMKETGELQDQNFGYTIRNQMMGISG